MTITADYLRGRDDDSPAPEPIAITGLACRLPGARDAGEFWRNLADGVESVRTWEPDEQAMMGVPSLLEEIRDQNYIPAAGLLDDVEYFDAAFFGMSAREAEVRDPQQRLFLELAYTALEDGGYNPAAYPGDIGVFAGTGEDAYQWWYTRRNPAALAAAGPIGVMIGSHPDYVATLASYKLNLHGPSMTLHTACSTSLVALHLACEALRNGECDMALTGGVNVDLPLGRGYIYVEGGVHSSDGHCRAFDARSNGTVWGSGGGVVLLKRLSDAIADRDHIRAVVLGNAVNNDGAGKVGFTAPSQQGQAAVIAQALALARVDPRTISYVEAHGTGTALGDPIEVGALSSVYRQYSSDVGWCGLGTVKSNIGHLGAAAGIAGLVKTVLSLEHGYIPPSLHYESPNPKIDFGSNPFYVNATLSRWESDPRRAAVSSFGIGGTNAHVILEAAPPPSQQRDDDRPVHLLQLSARTPTALDTAADRLSEHLAKLAGSDGSPISLADVAHTLRTGRADYRERLTVTASSLADAAEALTAPRRRIAGKTTATPPRIALMFPGQGAQYPGMGADLYRAERVFRDVLDECADTLKGHLGEDIRELILDKDASSADERLRETSLAQPTLFAVEYALALLWRELGVAPAGMVGHSIGEYVAATLADVFTLSDALAVVAARGRLMQAMPRGAMAAVQLAEAELRAMLPEELSVAAVNGSRACVVAGPPSRVEEFGRQLAEADVACRPLRTSHAFHSQMMDPMLADFRAVVAGVPLRAPQQPFLSNVTGDWITPADATDPSYWARHARETVQFADCVATITRENSWLLLECGPGQQLSGLARSSRGGNSVTAVPSLGRRDRNASDLEAFYAAAGSLWVAGVDLDLASCDASAGRVPLPTYPWERKYFWVRPEQGAAWLNMTHPTKHDRPPVDGWFTLPVWRQLPPGSREPMPDRCLLFADDAAEPLAEALGQAGSEVIRVRSGAAFGRDGLTYRIRPDARADYDALIADLIAAGRMPSRIMHAWALDGAPASDADSTWRAQDRGFFSLLNLVQTLAAAQPGDERHLDVITAGTQDVTGNGVTRPEHATVAGITKVVQQELPWLSTRHIDLDPADDGASTSTSTSRTAAAARAAAELLTAPVSGMIALRAGRRWELAYQEVTVPADLSSLPPGPGLRDRGVYLITGGLGGIGVTLAEDLARRVRARIVLVSRTGLPDRNEWDGLSGRGHTTERTSRAIAAIRRMESHGAEVMVLAADVTSPAAMRHVRDLVTERFGHVNGIVHAAGVPGGGMAEVKDRAAAETVLSPKILGTLALRDAFADPSPDFVVLCSSATALAGGFGQVDYCAANTFLDAYASSGHGWRAPVISVNWGSWLEVGMAAEVAAPAAFRVLQRGDTMIPVDHPMITARHDDGDERTGWCGGTISAASHWVLDEHRLAGVPVLPGTGHLEAVRCAAEAIAPSPDHALELRDVVLTEPLRVPDGSAADLRVVFSQGADGLDFEVITVTEDGTRTHARGNLAWVSEEAAERADISAIRDRCSLAVHEEGTSVSGLISFGPRWSSLRRVHAGHGEELAALEATKAVAAELGQWPLHPALLDEALSFAQMPGAHQYLPFGYGRVLIRRRLTDTIWSHLRMHETGSSEEVAVADVSIFDDAGNELVSISDFTMRRVTEASVSGEPGAPARAAATDSGLAGIRPAEGAAAFCRLVCADLGPQVAITAAAVEEIVGKAAGLTQETIEENLNHGMRSQPADATASGDYLAPRNHMEQIIAGIWAEVLGADRISVTDDFFELGGNSLVAVQVISMVRKETGLRLPVRTFFDAPTVAGAAAIAESLRGTAPDPQ